MYSYKNGEVNLYLSHGVKDLLNVELTTCINTKSQLKEGLTGLIGGNVCHFLQRLTNQHASLEIRVAQHASFGAHFAQHAPLAAVAESLTLVWCMAGLVVATAPSPPDYPHHGGTRNHSAHIKCTS